MSLAAGAWAVTVSAGFSRGDTPPEPDESHPIYSAHAEWVWPTLLWMGGLFAAALLVGPFVWMRARDTVPAATSHQEDPSADRR